MTNEQAAALKEFSSRLGKTDTPKSLEEIIRDGILRLTFLYDRELNPIWIPLWQEALRGIDAVKVERAFREVVLTFIPSDVCPFPVPAHIAEAIRD